MLACMQKLIFYNYCLSFYFLIGDFAISLGAIIVKVITRKENLGTKAKFI